MKATKFTDAQKAFIIRQGEEGALVADICRKAGISQATYFNWKKKYAGMMPSEMKHLRELEQENTRLKKIVADLSLDKAMLQDIVAEKFKAWSEKNAGRRDAIGLDDLDPPRLCGDPVRSQDVPIQVSSTRSGRFRSSGSKRFARLACGSAIGACTSFFGERVGKSIKRRRTASTRS